MSESTRHERRSQRSRPDLRPSFTFRGLADDELDLLHGAIVARADAESAAAAKAQ